MPKIENTTWKREWMIVDVDDTREFDTAKRKPIPGTGDARECDHCGRSHEVHVHVATRDGRTATIGTGCCLILTLDWSRVSTQNLRVAAIAKAKGHQ